MTEHRSVTAADGGTGMSTSIALIPIAVAGKLSGDGELALTGRNYSTAVVIKYLLNPRLTVLKTTDGNATFTDYSDAAQDGSTSTDVVLSSLPASPSGYVYLGTPVPVRGYTADMDGANGTAGTVTGDYWNGSAWTAASVTDGTASGGAPWAQDGSITFTVPTAWAKASLADILGKKVGPRGGTNEALHRNLYWIRLSNIAACDSSTTLNSIMPLNRATTYSEIVSGQTVTEVVSNDPDRINGVSCIEALTDAGTANLIGILAGNFTS